MFKKAIIGSALLLLSAYGFSQFTGKPRYQIRTERNGIFLGNIQIELFPSIAPKHTKNFDSLASKMFFDTTAFHRVIPGFVIQGGDPNSRHGPRPTWGMGDPTQPTVNAEFSVSPHLRGTIGAARDNNINSATSQFYICMTPQSGLNGNYTVYGHVTAGMNIADTIAFEPRDSTDNPLLKIEMFVTYTGSNDTLPTLPVLDTPISGTQNVGNFKTLKWFRHSDDIMYHLDVSTDSTFASFFKTLDVGVNYNYVGGLQDSTTYYWRVKGTNGSSWTGYSPTWNFYTAGAAGASDFSFEERGYRLYQNVPNPSKGQTIIKYTVPGKERITLKLFDLNGKEIDVLLDEEKTKGEYDVLLDMNKYSAGTYFYQIKAGLLSGTKKIIFEK